MTNTILTSHSGRLHSPAPLKKGAECILRELADLTWLFLKRKLHHGLLFFTLMEKIRVQSPPSNRPPLGNLLMGILSQSSLASLNRASFPLMAIRKYFSSLSESSESGSSSFCRKEHKLITIKYGALFS